MFGKIIASGLVLATVAGASLAATGTAEARYGRNGAFAGGAAAGVVGGLLLGGAIANQNRYEDEGPAYYEDPAPVYVEPRCYFQRQRVPNEYDPGWHIERVRVCQ
ncbi:hypothetical protein [Labrys monachus]|uniref:Glycine zipper domain-containing protein n=1 Tax=Labrys monachus TaxID=217067 RepID=A0ABU0FNW3_9HYPH|nr:hypothetical protein [Labrys monachus]MDQ0396151.1 hypothetical protein [Labrys monachus]